MSNERLRSKSNELAASDFTDKVIFFGYLIVNETLRYVILIQLSIFLFQFQALFGPCSVHWPTSCPDCVPIRLAPGCKDHAIHAAKTHLLQSPGHWFLVLHLSPPKRSRNYQQRISGRVHFWMVKDLSRQFNWKQIFIPSHLRGNFDQLLIVSEKSEFKIGLLLIKKHSVFAVWFLIILLIPDVSTRVQNKIRYVSLYNLKCPT